METLLMSTQERERLEVFGRVKEGTMKLGEASELLKLGYRQAKLAWSRYQKAGDHVLPRG